MKKDISLHSARVGEQNGFKEDVRCVEDFCH